MKTFRYATLVLKIYFKANGMWAVFDIANRLYSFTFYPLIQVWLLAELLNLFAARGVNLSFMDVAWMIELYIAANIVKVVMFWLAMIPGARNEFAIYDHIELEIDKKLNQLDPAVFESTKFQNLLAQMDGAKGTTVMYMVRLTSLINDGITFLTAAIVVSTQFPVFIPIVIFAAIPSFIASNKMRSRIWPFMSHDRSIVDRLFSYIRLTFSTPATSKEVAIFKNGPQLLDKFKRSHKAYYKGFEKAYSGSLSMMILTGLLQMGALVITQAINLAAVFSGKIAVGSFALFFQQTIVLSESAIQTLDDYSSMNMRTKYLDNYVEFLNYPNSITLSKKSEVVPTTPTPQVIEFKNVFFKYPDSENFILKNFNLIIESGEKIALVGENGAGKSTIIKLILRFYDVTDGEILINGVNIKNIDLENWHQNIGALFQDFIKYQFTFRENVIYGNLDKKDDLKAFREALRKSGAESIVADLPKAEEQIVGKTFEEGIDLSGGQWQKLALARAFFRDAPILILDEPTSAIDAKAEYEIFKNVANLQRDKTVIIISHRFSTVRNADRILVLDEGKIVEEGDHASLMKKKGLYEELFTIQAQGYK